MIKPDEEIVAGSSERFSVFAVAPFDEEDESTSVGLLQIERTRQTRKVSPLAALAARPPA